MFDHKLLRTMLVGTAACVALGSAASAQTRAFSVAAGDLKAALDTFGAQSGLQLIFRPGDVRGARSPGVTGTMPADEALNRLLAGTGFRVERDPSGAIAIMRGGSRSGEAQAGGAAADSEGAYAQATPDILVIGRRTINTDIRRTEDDPQPYVVFGADEIQQSQAATLEEFFRQRLPMNTAADSAGQTAGSAFGSQSSINLRGLGANQTLILIDGRRVPGVSLQGASRGILQPDVNGIPLASIERIEVLPSTASGIYGGGATGGVINIITKRDYAGIDLRATYGDTFRGDRSDYRLDASAGFNLFGRRTRVLIAGSYARSGELLINERDFARRSRALLLANDPTRIFTSTSPPLGATTNIRSQNGSNLVLDNGTPLNSPLTFVPLGYAGPATDGGAALVTNAGRYNLDLNDAIPVQTENLLANARTSSALLSVRHEFSDHVAAFADFGWTQNRNSPLFATLPTSTTLPANAPNNPFTTAISVAFPGAIGLLPHPRSVVENTSFRAAGGVIVRLPRSWTVSGDYVWGLSRNRNVGINPRVGDPDRTGPGISSATALANGTLNVVRDLNAFPLDWTPYLFTAPNSINEGDTTLHDATLRLSGPLLALPAGPLTLSGFGEWRKEIVNDARSEGTSLPTGFRIYPQSSQATLSLYLEARAPLVAPSMAIPLVRSLDLQASIRRDDIRSESPRPTSVDLPSFQSPLPSLTYFRNDVGATTFTLGLRYEPVRGIALRASYGTGFLAAGLNQITPNAPIPNTTTNLVDPRRGGVSAPVTYTATAGGNPNARPEASESWSIGAILTPRFAPGVRISADYTHIRKTDELTALVPQQLLDLEAIFSDRITRNALTADDTARGYTGGAITAIDTTSVNIAETRVEALDMQLDYELETPRYGNFRFYAVATWQPTFERRTLSTLPLVTSVGFTSGPLEWRGNVGLTWSKDGWTLGWNAQYYDSYSRCTATQAAASCAMSEVTQGGDVTSQTYHDVVVRYRFAGDTRLARGALSGVEIAAGIQNLFDRRPPILASFSTTASSADAYSRYGDPRMRRFTLSVRKQFGM